jgi:glycosyltransferase involved in cell wall biosynthesis
MRVLALVEAPDHVCCRYRIGAFASALDGAGWTLDVQGLRRDLVGRWSQCRGAGQFDTVVLQRKLLPNWQLAELRRHARHLVFDFDDAVLYRDSNDPRGPHCRRRARRFAATVAAADAVIAGNDFLADCALRAGARPESVEVIPTCLDIDRYRPVAQASPDKSSLDLVWIGSSSTLKGLERLGPLWERLAREIPGIRLRVICDRFPRFGGMPIIAVPWTEASEAAELAEGDVGVSWIPDDLWSRGKCGLKVLQYQAAGLPVIANPVGVQSEMVAPGVSGFLCADDEAWLDAARTLAADRAGRRRMGAAGRAAVEARYSVTAWAETFVATVSGRHVPSALSPAAARPAPRMHAGASATARRQA